MTDAIERAYDEVAYPSAPRVETQPDRLATVATLLGLSPAPPSRCRVLELGCSDGGNLLATACAAPDSEVVGIDLSARQVEAGQAVAAELGLKNLRLLRADLRELDPAALGGPFDYVIAHGVYSWIPVDLQQRLLETCRAALAPAGVAYVSCNTYPGWSFLDVVRQLMLVGAAGARDARDTRGRLERARAMLELVAAGVPDGVAGGAYAALLRAERDVVRAKPDFYLRHEYLAEEHHPVWFHELAARIERAGLQYMGDAQFQQSMSPGLGPELEQALKRSARSLVEREQLLDFLLDRTFRRNVLCRADARVDGRVGPARVRGLCAASAAAPAAEHATPDGDPSVPFRGPGGAELRTKHRPSRAALLHLAEAWPGAVPVADLVAHARSRLGEQAVTPQDALILEEHVLTAYARGLLDLHAEAPRLARTPGDRPAASPLARLRAARGEPVPNLRHEHVALDELERALLGCLDGTRDRAALLDEVARWVEAGTLKVEHEGAAVTGAGAVRAFFAGERLETILRRLGRAALLVG